MVPALILSSDSHVFEPPDLWATRIDAAFRDRAPRMQRIDGVDQIVIETDQILSGIGLISNAGARFEAPETISAHGRFEDVQTALRNKLGAALMPDATVLVSASDLSFDATIDSTCSSRIERKF